MALRINTNVAAINSHRQLLGTESKLNASMEKLSSGYRINRASDDAAGLAIANRLRTNVRSLTVASRNVSEGKALLAIAEGSANQIEGILERMKELATQAASANASSDTAKIDAEFDKLAEEITRISGDTKYQGTALLSSAYTGTFQVGSENATTSQIVVTTSALTLSGLGLSSAGLDSMTNAQSAITLIDSAIDTLATTLGNIGAGMNRLDYTYSNLQVEIENFSAAESTIRDVDMASEMVTYTKNSILLQAGTAMLAQANMSTQGVLSLFG
ncbi:MAG TPA: flagellin [Deltaproteobacteria bacterium]|nr:flagellin [Deltaproteobacteria bacterium]HPJ92659.1 flagellin [Deltaproteobacteria bacterium]HPR55205.1 flagellin [Deltaproteobacteria bacterium]